MEKLNFSTDIKAPREKVWEILWNMDSYRAWTSAFMEGSYVKTDNWKEGTKVLFLDPAGSGMVSTVAKNTPNEFMSFSHQGIVKDGVEDTTSENVKGWSGAKENYTLSGTNGATHLQIEMDITPDFKDYFAKTWPIALEKVKALAEGSAKTTITITTEVNAPVTKAWDYFNGSAHIMKWNQASPDWYCPAATNDLRPGGKLSCTMAAKDGSFSFEFGGVYDEVDPNKKVSYTLGDGRKVSALFEEKNNKTIVTETFEAENTHSLEMQRGGWQAILDSYKNYTEKN
jgi:uncharacterized protein YndB with AHSA1/START domain